MYSRSRYSGNRESSAPYPSARPYRPEWRASKSESTSTNRASEPPQEVRLPPLYSGNAFRSTDETAPRFDFHDSLSEETMHSPPRGTAHGLGDTARNLLLPHETEAADGAALPPPMQMLGEGQYAPRFPLYDWDDAPEAPFYPRRPRRPATQTEQLPIGNHSAVPPSQTGHSSLLSELFQGMETLPSLLGNLSEEEILLGTLIVLLLIEGKDDLMVLLLLFLLLS